MPAADYRILTDATGQRIATALEAQTIDKAAKADLSTIIATGTTNTTGAAITTDNPYFYLNGVLVKALTNIASGATFTNGTNYEVVTAGALNDLKTKKTGTITAYDNTVDIRNYSVSAICGIVNVDIYAVSSSAITQNAWTYFAVLPEGFRPSSNLFLIGTDNTHDISCNVQITTAGLIGVYGASVNSGMTGLKVNACFIS